MIKFIALVYAVTFVFDLIVSLINRWTPEGKTSVENDKRIAIQNGTYHKINLIEIVEWVLFWASLAIAFGVHE